MRWSMPLILITSLIQPGFTIYKMIVAATVMKHSDHHPMISLLVLVIVAGTLSILTRGTVVALLIKTLDYFGKSIRERCKILTKLKYT